MLENDAPAYGFSPLGSHTSKTVGNGGCTAFALTKLCVFHTMREAMDSLNAKIDVVKQKMRDDGDPNYYGVPDDRWHSKVVQLTVANAGYDFRKVELQTVDLKTLLKKGSYLIDGILNNNYVMMGERYDTDPDDTTTPASNEAGWRHSIAVQDGRILEKEFNMSAKWFWLGDNNRPDRTKGYMYKILKVYEITARSKKRSR